MRIYMAYKALDIANKLLLKSCNLCGCDLMSNLKLQKMLYYEQGYHLGAFGTPLFDEDIEAWLYGPAVPSVFRHFRSYGTGGILPSSDSEVMLSEDEEILFNEVFDAYVDFSAYGLMRNTHKEPPWRQAYMNQRDSRVISPKNMKTYFANMLVDA